MNSIENDKRKIRLIFDMCTNASKVEFETEIGKEIGRGVAEAVKIIKPYFIELANKLEDTNK